MEERCSKCKHCIPCKDLVEGEWNWFKICDLLAHEKNGFAIVVSERDMCECFEAKE